MLINPWNRKAEFLEVYDMQTEPGVIPKKIPFPSKQEKRPLLPLMNTIREKKNQSREFVMTSLWMLVDLVKVQTTDWDFTKIVVEETTTFPVLVRSFFFLLRTRK